jgi:3-hydroxybutyrate dehydrogenase
MANELTGRTALVTGGGAGIGAACARRLAAGGAKVLVVDRSAESAEKVAAEVGGWAHVVDLAEQAAIETLPAEVDILVNNAGLQHVAPLHEFPPEKFTLIQQVMVTAPFLLIRRCVPHMYANNWGRIVNVSSVHGLRASAYKAAYVAAKHGLEGLSKVAAIEGAPHGVTSNCVNPGYVRTPLVENQIEAQAQAHDLPATEVVEKLLLDRTPVKRLIEPAEVAALVRWLASEPGGSLSGASVPLDGAWTAN